jgi:hypothetical protein
MSCYLATQHQLQYAFAASGWSKTKGPALVGYASYPATLYIDLCVMVTTAPGQPKTCETKEHHSDSLFFFEE